MKRKLTKTQINLRGLKNTIQIIAKLVLAVLLVCLIYKGLDKAFKQKDRNYGISFRSLPKNTMDIIVLGSSHAEFSYNPEFIWEDLGLYSYVLYTECQPLEISYLMLKEAYKTQSPKLVVLEVYSAMPHQLGCCSDSSYVIPSYQMTGQERIDALNYLKEEKARNYYNDFNINHNNWRTMKSIEDLNFNDYSLGLDKISTTFGYRPLLLELPQDNYWPPTVYENDLDVCLKEKDEEALNNILKLCKEHNTELLLYATPMDGVSQEDQSNLHQVWNWAENNNIKYIDFFERSKTNGYLMHIHSDTDHAGVNGAGIITGDIAKTIKEIGYVFNHNDNKNLNNIYDYIEFGSVKDYLKLEFDPYKYIERIKAYKGTVILSYSGSSKELDQGFVNKLQLFNLPSAFNVSNPFIAIYKNNELLVSGVDSLDYELDGHKISAKGNTVTLDGAVINEEGPLSFTLFNDDYSDYITKRVNYNNDLIWETGFTHYNK